MEGTNTNTENTTTTNVEEQKVEQQTTQQQQPPAEEKKEAGAKLEAEEYKDFGEYEAVIDRVNIEKKIVPAASYGHRIRLAKLFDSHEEFMYKIIQVSGWARTVRSGGKDFCFIELHDGSSMKGL
jgi:hypothetical protein